MMLGKRPRPHIKRTTSITEFTVDLGYLEASIPSDPMSPSPRPHRRNSADFVETAHFLRVCGLCSRRLAPGRDIFMYRGDTAFCSLECRQQQIIQDERKEKCCLVSISNKESASATVGSETSTEGGTIAAA